MPVVTYVAFVAIANLCLGLMLAYVVPPSRFLPVEDEDEDYEPASDFQTHSSSEAMNKGADEFSEDFVADAQEPASVGKGSGDVSRPNASAAATWSSFTEQLRDIKQRTRYCRSSQDRRLAQQATGQLKSFIHEWYAELQTALDQSSACTTGTPLVTEANIGAAEMLSAQLESSLSNIEALDWSLKFDDVLNQLESELGLLDGQLRSVARSATSR